MSQYRTAPRIIDDSDDDDEQLLPVKVIATNNRRKQVIVDDSDNDSEDTPTLYRKATVQPFNSNNNDDEDKNNNNKIYNSTMKEALVDVLVDSVNSMKINEYINNKFKTTTRDISGGEVSSGFGLTEEHESFIEELESGKVEIKDYRAPKPQEGGTRNVKLGNKPEQLENSDEDEEDFDPKRITFNHQIPPQDRLQTPPGMTINLMEHQRIGLTWMVKQELNPKYRGGILADDMGLGKTVQMLSLMMQRPPKPNPKGGDSQILSHRVLIIATLSLIHQWENEIKEKLSQDLKILVYHGPARKKYCRLPTFALYDVVLTTYDTLGRDCEGLRDSGQHDVVNEVEERQRDMDTLKNTKNSPLFRTQWRRVILDEAHQVKNHRTNASKSIVYLVAKYRWCLTGTPIHNSLMDLFSLTRFLRIKSLQSLAAFKEYSILWDSKLSSREHLQQRRLLDAKNLLGEFVLKREKTGMVDGKPLLTLPEFKIEREELELTPPERLYYQFLEQGKEYINYMGEGGGVEEYRKSFGAILVLINRLRQATCHPSLTDMTKQVFFNDPCLLKSLLKQFVCSRKGQDLSSVNTLLSKLPKQVLTQLVLKKSSLNLMKCTACGVSEKSEHIIAMCGHVVCDKCLGESEDQGHVFFYGKKGDRDMDCHFGFKESDTVSISNFIKWVEVFFEDKELVDSSSVSKKLGSLSEAILGYKYTDGNRGQEIDSLMDSLNNLTIAGGPKPVDLDLISNRKSQPDGSNSDSDDDNNGTNGKNNKELDDELIEQVLSYFPPSCRIPMYPPTAKTKKILSIIKNISKTNPGDKIVIFSYFGKYMEYLEETFRREGIGCIKVDGKVNGIARSEMIRKFSKDRETKVLVLSILVGSVGLNLTRANRVIMADLWWNPAIEMQAVDRVRRIGQTKPVTIYRLAAKNTIDDRILDVQKTKQSIISSVIGSENDLLGDEETGDKAEKGAIVAAKPSMREMMYMAYGKGSA
ncbi:hypothetical protein H4219_003170 [Mycoemilia scoparia]|uniref:Uncharacterized protein n=1 Tax=Mycoemilia scoparia TaxID=417184 RepID=A0A9W7ZWB5_9FUNG|nr:hypothetical protein H4219_003170 [Mycoemilia scoparia]